MINNGYIQWNLKRKYFKTVEKLAIEFTFLIKTGHDQGFEYHD